MAFVSPLPNAFFKTAVISALVAASLSAAFQFEVGDDMAWKKPTGKDPKTYNEWAAQNRFHIKDTLHFKYENDSVLVASPADYLTCNTTNPISDSDDGSTVFQFDRPGFFYFISGQPGHCKSGQRLIVRVMHPSLIAAPEHAPSPAPSGDDSAGDSGLPRANSSPKLFGVSCFVTALVASFVMIYLVI